MDILEVDNLTVEYPVRTVLTRRTIGKVHAVRGVSFSVKRGETLAVVGESGSGKTTMGKAVARLTAAKADRLQFDGEDLLSASGSSLRSLRQRLQMVFQNPYTSLDRSYSIRRIIEEPLKLHSGDSKFERSRRVNELLELVALRHELGERYLANLSGGQRQRVCHCSGTCASAPTNNL